MIIQKENKAGSIVNTTYIDGIDKVDVGVFDDGTSFCNIYKSRRKKDDDFETIKVEGFDIYILNDSGKTIRALRSRKIDRRTYDNN